MFASAPRHKDVQTSEGIAVERSIAERLMSIVAMIDEPLNQATELSFEVVDVEEQRALRRAIAETTGTVYEQIILPIIRQFPDLDPEGREGANGSA